MQGLTVLCGEWLCLVLRVSQDNEASLVVFRFDDEPVNGAYRWVLLAWVPDSAKVKRFLLLRCFPNAAYACLQGAFVTAKTRWCRSETRCCTRPHATTSSARLA